MSNEDPSGYVSKATIFNKSAYGSPFVAGEKGKEWIAPNWMLNNPRTVNIIFTLKFARKEKRMYATGGFNEVGISNPTIPPSYDFYRLEDKLDAFINTQAKFNAIPVVLNYQQKEEFERKLQFDRTQQIA